MGGAYPGIGCSPLDNINPLHGYRIPFQTRSPLLVYPIEFPSYSSIPSKSFAHFQEVLKLLNKDALEIIEDPSLGFYSFLSLVKKFSGGLETGNRSLSSERVYTDVVQNRNDLFCSEVCQKGQFRSLSLP